VLEQLGYGLHLLTLDPCGTQVEAASATLEEGLQQSVEALKGAAGGIERRLEVRD
jgi:hypothetical protein